MRVLRPTKSFSLALLAGCLLCQPIFAPAAESTWKNPLVKQGYLGSPLVEVTPFVFNDRLYLLENHQKFWDLPGEKPGTRFLEDEVRIRDVETGKLVSVAMTGHGFATAMVWEGRVYVFAGDYGRGKPWRYMSEINMVHSDDLVHWTKPKTVIRSENNERIFNTAVCRGKDGFVLLYETNDRPWPAFTFKYCVSDDLVHWKRVPGAVYGKKKYVGGPALYYEGGHYYTLYLFSFANGKFETRIARSKDLIQWEDAPEDRPLVTFDPAHTGIPLHAPEIHECNASDAELCYFQGKTIVYFTGGDQHICGDLQRAEFDGTPRQLLECFFKPDVPKKTGATDTTPPEHAGDWAPVLIAPAEDVQSPEPDVSSSARTVPDRRQLAYQNDQLGAFVHFGPATYIGSDMLSTPKAEIFNPDKLDAEQWVLAAKSFGAKHIVLTAKHHNGFCLWPTKTTEYCVRNSPWKNGKGDVVGELAEACRKHDLKLGLYLSGGDKHFPCWSTMEALGQRKIVGDRDAYFPVFMGQLKELLTGYGDVCVVWLDGWHDPFGWDVADPKTGKRLGTAHGDAIASYIHKTQPDAAIMGGTKPDVRWSGSEQGWAAYPLWNIVPKGQGVKHWIPPTEHGWHVPEACLHTRATWFWKPGGDGTLRSVEKLMEAYYTSIGRGASLLINMTPDTQGLIPQVEVDRLAALGKQLQHRLGKPLATTNTQSGWTKPGVLELDLGQPRPVTHVVIEEDITTGEHVLEYAVDRLIGDFWEPVAQGQSIGRKRIEQLDGKKARKIRLRILKADAVPSIRAFGAY